MNVLITGAAGFIGMHLGERLLERGDTVTGVDNMNNYYDPQLKRARLHRLARHPGFRFWEQDIADRTATAALFESDRFDAVVNLAAQAGVRYSLKNPHAYIEANVVGFMNILEGCRHHAVKHLVYASSSSVYGGNERMPFSEAHGVDHPVSLYAATKKANELMAHTYSHLYGLPTTGLRFFTVYGPWGRPDMALFLFTKAILQGLPIDVFNEGRMQRDFTYIDDIVEGLVRTIDRTPAEQPEYDRQSGTPGASWAPYRVFNIGNQGPVQLLGFIAAIERALGRKAQINLLPMQPGDVQSTFADVTALTEWTGFKPSMSIEKGVEKFVVWYREYFRV